MTPLTTSEDAIRNSNAPLPETPQKHKKRGPKAALSTRFTLYIYYINPEGVNRTKRELYILPQISSLGGKRRIQGLDKISGFGSSLAGRCRWEMHGAWLRITRSITTT
jgi:hypothetical protein